MSGYVVKYEPSSDIAKAKNEEKDEAMDIIDKDAPTFIDKNMKPKTLAKRKLVRLDLQGQFNRDGKRYANLQIQLNKPRMAESEEAEMAEESTEGATGVEMAKPKSTTISIVLMPSGEHIPENISQEAFTGSLDKKMKAIIEQN